MSEKFYSRCLSCSKEYSSGETVFSCTCGQKVDTIVNIHNFAPKKEHFNLNKELDPLFRYFDFFPLFDKDDAISVGTTITPFFKSKRLSDTYSHNIFIKNETLNPSGSFKIKPLTVGFNYGREKIEENRVFTIASCGNAADALSCLAAKSGDPIIIFVPEDTPSSRLASLRMKGAFVIPIKRLSGELGDPTYKMMRQCVNEFGWVPVPSSGQDNSAQIEGGKAISFEICEQSQFCPPDHVVIQVGGGGLLNGIIKGFSEFYSLGFIESLPTIHAVQSEGCAPFVEAFNIMKEKNPNSLTDVDHIIKSNPEIMREWKNPHSVAWGILDDFTYDFHIGLRGLISTSGSAFTVSEKEILDAYALAPKYTGIFASPTGVVGLAGVIKLINNKCIEKNESIMAIFTGSGYKQLNTAIENTKLFSSAEPELNKIVTYLKEKYSYIIQ